MTERTYTHIPARGEDTHKSLLLRLALLALINAVTLLEIGFYESPIPPLGLTITRFIGLGLLWFFYIHTLIKRPDRSAWFRAQLNELTTLTAATIIFPFHHLTATWLIALLLLIILTRLYITLTQRIIQPGLLFIASFIAMIIIGSVLLKLPKATPIDNPITWLDAGFTATSAVSVTGLIVRDTAVEFTTFGQTIILLLIQLGGLGIILFGSLFAVMLTGSLSLRHASSIREVVQSNEVGISDISHLLRFVIIASLLTEFIGAIIIYFGGWPDLTDTPTSQRLFESTFLSISAFCNAGFAPYTDSLIAARFQWCVHMIIAPLIIIGGLGFPALYNLWNIARDRITRRINHWTHRPTRSSQTKKLIRLTFHTKIVITMTIGLYMLGVLGLTLSQTITPDPGAAQQSIGHNILDASFMCVSARTAGFNTMEMNELTTASRFLLMILMWIGGSPSSTAGGIKTVAIAVILLTIWATWRNRSQTEAYRRTVPESLVRRAIVIVTLGTMTIATTAFLLTLTEPVPLTDILFESVSACSTVGLSTGITDTLSSPGRVVIIMAMFLGRVGPLAILGILTFRHSHREHYHYPTESLVIG